MLRKIIKQTTNCAKQQIREYAQRHRYRPNSGIRRQANAETNEIETETTNWDDDLSKYEGDLTNAGETYQQYRQETETEREHLRRNIVRNKYFNEKNPSFLTWGEMEQMRRLNAKDPEEWNDQKLAESFPADVGTIRKILKSDWQPKDGKRVAKYDEKVRSNWKSFVQGEFKEMDERFSEHLQKFSKRNLNANVNYDSVLKKEMPKPEKTEFLGIITSCKKYKVEPKQIESQYNDNAHLQPKQLTKECATPKSYASKKLYKFESISQVENVSADSRTTATIFNNPSWEPKQISSKSDENANFQTKQSGKESAIPKGIASNKLRKFEPISQVENGPINSRTTATVVNNPNGTGSSKFEVSEVQLTNADLKELSVPYTQRHIFIPAKLFKEGATYRVDDCFYDDDGEFMYRVPGMTKC